MTDSPRQRAGNRLEFRAAVLLCTAGLLLAASLVYLMIARGAFNATSMLVLTTDNSEGAEPGMDLTFSGFPIGRVRRIELAPDASVRIVVDVEQENMHWLRTSSVFTLERGIVGATRIRAFSGILTDPALPEGAQRELLRGDVQAEIPRLVVTLRELIDNLKDVTASDSALSVTFGNVRQLSDGFNKPGGVVGALLGDNASGEQLGSVLQRTNALLARADRLLEQAGTQVFGKNGVTREAQATVSQLNRTLQSTQRSLARVDSVLKEAQGIAANTRGATDDLSLLRSEVESSLRNLDRLVNEVNQRLPFSTEPRVRLP
ncbi:MAG: MlaD family protein [Burkholderiaceae bacterium]